MSHMNGFFSGLQCQRLPRLQLAALLMIIPGCAIDSPELSETGDRGQAQVAASVIDCREFDGYTYNGQAFPPFSAADVQQTIEFKNRTTADALGALIKGIDGALSEMANEGHPLLDGVTKDLDYFTVHSSVTPMLTLFHRHDGAAEHSAHLQFALVWHPPQSTWSIKRTMGVTVNEKPGCDDARENLMRAFDRLPPTEDSVEGADLLKKLMLLTGEAIRRAVGTCEGTLDVSRRLLGAS